MAYAAFNLEIMNYKVRRNELNDTITNLQSQKRLALNEQLDYTQLIQAKKTEQRNYWKNEYETNKETTYCDFVCYSDIEEYKEAIDKIQADYETFQAELTAWETDIDLQISTADVELKEVEAYLESYESMMSENISNDFDYSIS